MGYIGTQPVPRANRVLTEGVLDSDSQYIEVPAGFSPGNIYVYVNGVRLRSSDYNDSDGFQVDLEEEFPEGTEYTIEEIRTFEDSGLEAHKQDVETHGAPSGKRLVHTGDAGSEYAAISGGADANFTSMPQVDGDPIVESGSNSDGEWVRYADGTQICWGVKSFTGVDFDSGLSGDCYRNTAPDGAISLPVSFSGSIGDLSAHCQLGGTGFQISMGNSLGVQQVEVETTDEIRVMAVMAESITDVDFSASFSVSGRWK